VIESFHWVIVCRRSSREDLDLERWCWSLWEIYNEVLRGRHLVRSWKRHWNLLGARRAERERERERENMAFSSVAKGSNTGSTVSKADRKAALDVGAWLFNVSTSVGIIMVNKQLMANYGFRFGITLSLSFPIVFFFSPLRRWMDSPVAACIMLFLLLSFNCNKALQIGSLLPPWISSSL